ncbi:MAG: hypothetical protein JOY80_05375 [Candidatus Dormibacteraeota bacterium]|nr:hypothetical protein [Candidatus Dormibacteraeota bacterium]
MADGCSVRGGVRCNYVDRRSRPCTTTWCSAHWVTVGGKQYCRRHAGIVVALGGAPAAGGWPDVDNRAASLAAWVGRQIDSRVTPIFSRVAPAGGARLVNEPVRLMVAPAGGSRRWQRAWRLVDHTGVLNRVSIEVDESNDADVMARVDAELIGHGVPPWIEHRNLAAGSPDAEAARRSYIDAIARSIELVVTKQELVPQY